MKPNIAIILDGGLVQNIITDQPANIVVIDHDTEGAEKSELEQVKGIDNEVYVSHWPEPELDPAFVAQFADTEEKPGVTQKPRTEHKEQTPQTEETGRTPVAYAVFANNGNIRIWSKDSEPVRKLAEREGLPLVPLYAPQKPQTPQTEETEQAQQAEDVPQTEDVEPALIRETSNDPDYIMPPEMTGCWIKVGEVSVHLVHKNDHLTINTYPLGDEMADPINTMEVSTK